MVNINSQRLQAKSAGQPIWYIVAGPEQAVFARSQTAAGFKALPPEDTRRILQEAFPRLKDRK
jgi:hypothetical protein